MWSPLGFHAVVVQRTQLEGRVGWSSPAVCLASGKEQPRAGTLLAETFCGPSGLGKQVSFSSPGVQATEATAQTSIRFLLVTLWPARGLGPLSPSLTSNRAHDPFKVIIHKSSLKSSSQEASTPRPAWSEGSGHQTPDGSWWQPWDVCSGNWGTQTPGPGWRPRGH